MVSLRVAREEMQQFFLKKLFLLVSFRGQKMREPRPDWSPLGVNFKILDEHPYLFSTECTIGMVEGDLKWSAAMALWS